MREAEKIRRALDLSLMVAEDLSKGYRDSDEEDTFQRCPACKGWDCGRRGPGSATTASAVGTPEGVNQKDQPV